MVTLVLMLSPGIKKEDNLSCDGANADSDSYPHFSSSKYLVVKLQRNHGARDAEQVMNASGNQVIKLGKISTPSIRIKLTPELLSLRRSAHGGERPVHRRHLHRSTQ
jgi:hypothetical protein